MIMTSLTIGQYIGIRFVNDMQDSICWGIVKRVSHHEIEVDVIYRDGQKSSGCAIYNLDEIASIEMNNLSTQCMEILARKQVNSTTACVVDVAKLSSISDISAHVVSLLDDDGELASGFITSIDDNTILIKCLDEFGRFDGMSLFSKNVVHHIRMNSIYEQELSLLFKTRGQK